MTDRVSPAIRSRNMKAIRSKGMKPEIAVRKLAHAMGYRFRLHKAGLPGKPDLVFASRRKVIFVHGCFWHGHDDPSCQDGRLPKSNLDYWVPKLERNKVRDASHIELLQSDGWDVEVIWECETRDTDALRLRLARFLGKMKHCGAT